MNLDEMRIEQANVGRMINNLLDAHSDEMTEDMEHPSWNEYRRDYNRYLEISRNIRIATARGHA